MRKFSSCLVSVFLLSSFYLPNTVAAFLSGQEPETQTKSPTTRPYAKLSLRKKPKKNLTGNAVWAMLKKHGFYERKLNPNGRFDNDFVDDDDGTVTDRATGLMWQKDGSPKPLTLKRAAYYIYSLNNKRFMGYSDWRMPTVEELASLIKGNVGRGLYIDPLFTKKHCRCWSSDSGFVEDKELRDVWIVDFVRGRVNRQILTGDTNMLFTYSDTYFVRGVRTAR
jgi:hypothetical protein